MSTLADKITAAFNKTTAPKGAIRHAVTCGRLLTKAKQDSGRGEWKPFLESSFPGSHRTATDYMRLSDAVKSGALPEGWQELSIAQALAMLPKRKRRKSNELDPKPDAPKAYQGSGADPMDQWGLLYMKLDGECEKLSSFLPASEGKLPGRKDAAKRMIDTLHAIPEGESVIGTTSGEWNQDNQSCDASKSVKRTRHVKRGVVRTYEQTHAPKSGYGDHPDWAGHGVRVTIKVEVV